MGCCGDFSLFTTSDLAGLGSQTSLRAVRPVAAVEDGARFSLPLMVALPRPAMPAGHWQPQGRGTSAICRGPRKLFKGPITYGETKNSLPHALVTKAIGACRGLCPLVHHANMVTKPGALVLQH